MNKKILPLLLLDAVFTVSFFSCKRPDAEPILGDETLRYIPLQKGKYIIYEVDSTIWYDTACVELKRNYQMMYTVADTFTDVDGRTAYRIDTRIRKETDEPWMAHDVLYVKRTETTVEWSQSEHKFIKMTFPVENNATWQGNAYVQTADADHKYFDGWAYRYSNVGESFNNGFVVYPKTITVNQVDRVENDPEELPHLPGSKTFGKEVFAENIGLVYREYVRWTYDHAADFNNSPNQQAKCRRGHGVLMRAVSHN